jgi:hypothetical protein
MWIAKQAAMLSRALLSLSLVALAALATGCLGSPDTDETEPVGEAEEALAVHTVNKLTTISYAPNSFVIGNAYSGWTDKVQGNAQFSSGPGNPHGVSYRWGYLYGEGFDHCAWIADANATGTVHEDESLCGSPQEIDTAHFDATYTNGIKNHLAGDGSTTHMHYAGSGCTDVNGYGNVEPWKVPATPHNSLGAIPDGALLRWRYVTKDGKWVMVHNPAHDGSATLPNWHFVHRGCVSVANVD